MVALAQPERFEDSTPALQIVNVPHVTGPGNPGEVRFFTTAEPYIWRVRSVAAHGRTDGTVGTSRIGLSFDISGAAGEPWTNALGDSGIQAMSPQELNPGDSWAYTWSTEIGDSYTSSNVQWGKTAMLGLPMVWLPPHTDIVIELSGFGGYDGELTTTDGYMMIEYLTQGAALASGAGNADLYLLPALG